MAPPKENFLAPPLSLLVCLSFLPRRMLCIILSLKLPCQVFLVGTNQRMSLMDRSTCGCHAEYFGGRRIKG